MKRLFGETFGELVQQRKANFIFHKGREIFSDDSNFQHFMQEELSLSSKLVKTKQDCEMWRHHVQHRNTDFIIHRGCLIFADDSDFHRCMQEQCSLASKLVKAKPVQSIASFIDASSVGSKNFQNLKENSEIIGIDVQQPANKIKSCRVLHNTSSALNEQGREMRTFIEFVSNLK